MPFYNYECICGTVKEEFRRVADRNECPACDKCSKVMQKIISTYSVIGDVDYYDDNLQSHVKSRKHRKQIMREQGVSEKFGSNWHTGANNKRRA